MIEIQGVRSGADIRAELAQEEAVLLAFSGGKDAICAWLALRDSGVKVIPYYMFLVPDLQFVEGTMAYFEDYFGTRIARYPHPSLYRWLNSYTFQPPERLATIEAAQLPEPDYDMMVDAICTDHGLTPRKTWVADGVRAADSIVRRVSIKRHGPMKWSNHKVSPIWDWQIADIREAMSTGHGLGWTGDVNPVKWPVDYEWFDRSFDGLDYRFLAPLKEHAPDDFQRVLDWFPLAEMELIRHGI